MKTKKKKSPVNNYKPVRVVNPTASWHTTRVWPCQSVLLKLRKPSVFLFSTDDDARFEVSLYSDFLIVEQIESDMETGDCVYTISPKFDLTDWSDYGEVLLGELNIKLIDNNHPDRDKQKYCCNVCFIQQSRTKSDVLTVVNPSSHAVKLEPHQLLSVVCYETSWNDKEQIGLRDEWDNAYNDIASNEHRLHIKQVKYDIAGDREGVLAKEEGPFAVKNRFNFRINPRLTELGKSIVEQELKTLGKPVREHHWWFACDEETLKKVTDLSNGVYQIGTFDFEGQCSGGEQSYSTIRSLDVLLTVQGKNKHKMHPYYLNPDSVEHKMELVKRSEDRFKQILTNPLSVEQVDFHPGYESITLEMIQPSALWSDLDDKVEWEFKLDDNPLAPKNIKITPLTSYYRWGKLFQRVKIDHDFVPKNDVETKFLGAVFVLCSPKQAAHHDGKKRISFWLTPNDKRSATSYSTSTKKSSSSSGTSSYSYGPTHNPNGSKKKEKEYKKPQIAELTIEEIACVNLEDAEKTKKVSEVWISSGSSHHYCCGDDFYQVSKKKGGSTNSTSVCPSRSFRATSADENKKEKKEGSSEKASGSTSGSRETGQTRFPTAGSDSARTVFIVYNPDHLNKVTLEYGQTLIVRMTMPNKVNNDHWALSWDSCDGALQVKQFKTITVGDSFYQEAIAVVEKVPASPGIHPSGCLRFTSSKGTKVTFVQVKVKKDDKISVPDHPVPSMRIVPPTRCYDGNSNRKLYISEWMHNDAVVVDPTETFYIRNPAHISGWSDSDWQMEVEQYPLPDEVWHHDLLKDVIGDIDPSNPWFRTAHPLQLTSTYVFRPLNVQQPHVMLILQAAAEVMNLDHVTLARITFRNCHHPKNTRLATATGIIETSYTLERSIGICVDLVPYKRKEVTLVNPNTCAEFAVSGDEMIIIKLSPRFVEMERAGKVKAPWFVGPWPEFFDFKGQAQIDGDDVFRFSVRGNYPESKKGEVRFICGNTEKLLVAKYEKK